MKPVVACLLAMAVWPGLVHALPEKIECIAGAKAGGGFDLTCKLAEEMLQGTKEVRTTYLPGGIGAVAFTTFATRRRAEAGSLVAFSSGSLLNLAQGKFGPYSESDGRWIAVVGVDYGVLAVRNDSPLRSLGDLAKAVKADPRAVTFGAGGTIGSQDWFKAALVAIAAGANHKSMRFVAFEGGGDAIAALRGGHVSVFAGDAAEVLRNTEQADGLRLLAVLSKERIGGALANVPTAREQGFDIVWPIARGFYIGAGVSEPDAREWEEVMRQAMAAPGFPRLLTKYGLYPMSLTGHELRTFITEEMARYRRMVAQFQLTRAAK